MSEQVISFNEALGETSEYGEKKLVPESYYAMTLYVGEAGIKDNEKQTPYVKVSATIDEGPFAGIEVADDFYLTPGDKKYPENTPLAGMFKGGGLGLYLGATKALTGRDAPSGPIAQKYGITLPPYTGGDKKEFYAAVRHALAKGFFEMDPAKRLAFMLDLFQVKQWEGKKFVGKVELESREYKENDNTPITDDDRAAGIVKVFQSNRIRGFHGLGDTKKGIGYVRNVSNKQQVDLKAQMEAEGVL